MPALEALDLPTGHRFEIGGEIEDQEEANENLEARVEERSTASGSSAVVGISSGSCAATSPGSTRDSTG